MKTYIAQRVGIGLLTLLGMSIVIFGMLRLAPGDIVDILFSTGGYVNPVVEHRNMPPGEPVPAGFMNVFDTERDRYLALLFNPTTARAANNN